MTLTRSNTAPGVIKAATSRTGGSGAVGTGVGAAAVDGTLTLAAGTGMTVGPVLMGNVSITTSTGGAERLAPGCGLWPR